MIRIAVCDDNAEFLKKFSYILRDILKNKKISADVNSYARCDLMLQLHGDDPFDVVFLDIDMPKINGFHAAKTIAAINPKCYIIFVTSHNELVYDSFKFRPLNFIVKERETLMRQRLETVIGQLTEQMLQDEYIVLDSKIQGRLSLCLRDIIYIESCDHHVLYYTRLSSEPIKVRDKLSDAESRLGSKGFIRIHKKYLVNLRHIFNIDLAGEAVILKDGDELPMSRSHKNEVDERLTEYLRSSV